MDGGIGMMYEVAKWKGGEIVDDGDHFDNLNDALECFEEQLEEENK